MSMFVTRTVSDGWRSKLARTMLLTGASAFATGIAATPAFAQTTPQPPAATQDTAASAGTPAADDEIVVTGIRASLDSAAAIRRNSEGIVDAIVAEDIGKFPDTNLAESLQR